MTKDDRDYQILDINIKAGIAFTLVTAVIIWLVLLITK